MCDTAPPNSLVRAALLMADGRESCLRRSDSFRQAFHMFVQRSPGDYIPDLDVNGVFSDAFSDESIDLCLDFLIRFAADWPFFSPVKCD
jgi:hypothetical protein